MRWYPRAWRKRHEDEFTVLLEDSMSERPFSPHRALDVAMHGLRLRAVELRESRHRMLVGSSASLIVLIGVVAVVTNGFGLLAVTGPTKGPIPLDANVKGRVDLNKVPDFVATVGKGGKVIGYVPKADLFPPSTTGVHLGPQTPLVVEPVYAGDLRTLVGHLYPGVGFVPRGVKPSTETCLPETTVANGQVQPIPCPSSSVTVPSVVGMFTPTAVGKLSGLGLNVQIVNVKSSSVAPGHIVSISPPAGSNVFARSVVTVDISVRVS